MDMIDCLIVEDSPTQALKLQDLLERHGYSTEVTHNGLEALARLKSLSAAIIISDVVMPEMNGYDLCRRLKADPDTFATAVLLLTTLSDPEDIFRALECGADNFIVKPADEAQLINRVEYLIANRKVNDRTSMEAGLEVNFGGQRQFITSSRLQILNLLLSTYDVAVRKNKELQDMTDELQRLNDELERKVQERTRHLVQEMEERKAAESSIRRLVAAIEQSPRGIVILDSAGKVSFSNAAAGKTFKSDTARDSVEGMDLGIEEVTGRRVQEAWKEFREGGGNLYQGIFIRRTQPGREEFYDVLMKRVFYDQAKEPLYMVNLENSTDRHRLEAQVRRKDRLESIGTLAGGIAHDFNNILSAVLGYAEFGLEDIGQPEPLREDLDQIRTAGIRARNLVRQILRFGKSQEGTFAPTRVDVVIKEALELLRATLPRSIEIRTVFSEPADEVMADATQIHQLIMNLCTNAQHAMEGKAGLLELRVEKFHFDEVAAGIHPDLDPGDYVRIAVSDNGHGMDRDTVQRIFDPFFTTKEPGIGTGLGMSTCHSIVQEHRGAITVYSEVGRGTTFHIYLPSATRQEIVGGFQEQPQHVPGGSERVLVVDDESVLARMLQRQLQDVGYHVRAFTAPEECLQAILEAPEACDVLITDATMPNLSGLELAAAARKAKPDLPVILISGLSNHVRKDAAEVSAYLTKPVSLIALRQALRAVLDGMAPPEQ